MEWSFARYVADNQFFRSKKLSSPVKMTINKLIWPAVLNSALLYCSVTQTNNNNQLEITCVRLVQKRGKTFSQLWGSSTRRLHISQVGIHSLCTYSDLAIALWMAILLHWTLLCFHFSKILTVLHVRGKGSYHWISRIFGTEKDTKG